MADRIAGWRQQGGFVPEVVTRLAYDTPPLVADPASAATGHALMLLGRNETSAVSYGTEAGIYQEAGYSTVVCGPGDIQQAHAADEWVAVEQIESCVAFVERLIDDCTLR